MLKLLDIKLPCEDACCERCSGGDSFSSNSSIISVLGIIHRRPISHNHSSRSGVKHLASLAGLALRDRRHPLKMSKCAKNRDYVSKTLLEPVQSYAENNASYLHSPVA